MKVRVNYRINNEPHVKDIDDYDYPVWLCALWKVFGQDNIKINKVTSVNTGKEVAIRL